MNCIITKRNREWWIFKSFYSRLYFRKPCAFSNIFFCSLKTYRTLNSKSKDLISPPLSLPRGQVFVKTVARIYHCFAASLTNTSWKCMRGEIGLLSAQNTPKVISPFKINSAFNWISDSWQKKLEGVLEMSPWNIFYL